MSKVTAVSKAHTENSIARLEKCKVNSCVSLSTGVWLYVSVLSAEKLASSLDSDFLYFVNALTSAVVSLARIAFSVLVCEYRTHSSHNSRGNDVLTCDKFEVSLLTSKFFTHSFADSRIIIGNKSDRIHKIVIHSYHSP